MRNWRFAVILGAAAAALIAIGLAAGPTSAEDVPAGQALFLANKCEMCHAVPSVGIEARTKSEKMLGPEIAGIEADPEELAKFLRKQKQLNDKDHKKEFKGTDEELKALVHWILDQKSG